MQLFGGLFGSTPLGTGPRIDYSMLKGMKGRSSFAFEAGQHALAGKIPATSSDGYAIATLAGGCCK